MKKAEKEGKIQLKKYLKEDKTKYKNNFIDENDLVWIIDEMEMNLRKKERNKKKIVWMPCKGDI